MASIPDSPPSDPVSSSTRDESVLLMGSPKPELCNGSDRTPHAAADVDNLLDITRMDIPDGRSKKKVGTLSLEDLVPHF